jgi:outer membrane protein
MKRTFIATAMFAVVFTISALAQSGSPAPGGAAATSPASTAASSAAFTGGPKIGTIDMQGAIAASNEGARDFEALNKKFEPRRNELQNLNTEIENLQKQLNTQGDKMNEETRANLVKSIEGKKKSLQRSMEDAQTEYQQQGSEIAQRLVQKLAPVIEKYVRANGYGLLLDSSGQWPQGPIVMTSAQMDITKAIVDAYNAQSGVAPPAAGVKPGGTAASKPAGTTSTPATKPAPATTKPQQ